jgi:hypothetical protein
LFGAPSPVVEAKPKTKKEKTARKAESRRGGGSSEWLVRWHALDEDMQPSWWKDCDQAVADNLQRVGIEISPTEKLWLEVVYLVMGHSDRRSAIIDRIRYECGPEFDAKAEQKTGLPGVEQLITWLPEADRRELVPLVYASFHADKKRYAGILRALTYFDDMTTARWLIESGLPADSAGQVTVDATNVRLFLNSMLGTQGADMSHYVQSPTSGYRSNDDYPVYRDRAIELILDVYDKSTQAHAKPFALAALAWLDRTKASDIAKSTLMTSGASPAMFSVSKKILFDDLPEFAHATAVELLSSSNPDIVDSSLLYIVQPPSSNDRDWNSPIPAYYNYSYEQESKFPELPGETKEMVESLTKLTQVDRAITAARAKLLLISQGNDYPIEAFEPLKESVGAKKLVQVIAAAYIAGNRNDEAALKAYETVLNETNGSDLTQFYKALSKVSGSEIKKLRRRVLAKSNESDQ